jgi:hypothetical protein
MHPTGQEYKFSSWCSPNVFAREFVAEILVDHVEEAPLLAPVRGGCVCFSSVPAAIGRYSFFPDLFVISDQSLLEKTLAQPPAQFHVYLGHCEWGAGQLESRTAGGIFSPAEAKRCSIRNLSTSGRASLLRPRLSCSSRA